MKRKVKVPKATEYRRSISAAIVDYKNAIIRRNELYRSVEATTDEEFVERWIEKMVEIVHPDNMIIIDEVLDMTAKMELQRMKFVVEELGNKVFTISRNAGETSLQHGNRGLQIIIDDLILQEAARIQEKIEEGRYRARKTA
jgi:hypothetical protein